MESKNECPHLRFETEVIVTRLTEVDGGPVTGYCADMRIRCAHCQEHFEFIGVPAGYSPEGPMASSDFLKLGIPIRPSTGRIADKITYQVRPNKANPKNIN